MDHDHGTDEWDARRQERPRWERLDVGEDPLRTGDTGVDTSQDSHPPARGYAGHDEDANGRSAPPPNAPFRHRLDSQASDLDSPEYVADDHEDSEHLTSRRRVARYEGHLELRQHGRSLRESVGNGGGRALSALGKSIRRASVRVVNVTGVGLQEQQNHTGEHRLNTVPPPSNRDDIVLRIQVPTDAEDEAALPEMGNLRELRGRTLCFFGPTNPLRFAMQKVLLWTYVSPLLVQRSVLISILSSDGLNHLY
jgi:hypothetical protein